MQDRAISFKTGLQGGYVQPGDLIYVQHLITEFDRECSGFVQEVVLNQVQTGGTYISNFRLSTPIREGIGLDTGYLAAIFRLQDGGIQTDLPVQSYYDETTERVMLSISALTVPLQPVGENRTGDYVCISRVTEQKRIYRVNSIDPQPDGTVGISAVIWIPSMLEPDGLVSIY